MIPTAQDIPRPFRSVLYIPGANQRALEKAATLPCDAIIFDLEDAFAPEEKPRARALVAEMLRTTDFGNRARIVRINALDTAWGREDCLSLIGVQRLVKALDQEQVVVAVNGQTGAVFYAAMKQAVGIGLLGVEGGEQFAAGFKGGGKQGSERGGHGGL